MNKFALVKMIISSLPKDVQNEILDDLLDWLEEKVQKTNTKWDDRLVKLIRNTLDVPDGND